MTHPLQALRRLALLLALSIHCTPQLVQGKPVETTVSPVFDARLYEKVAVVVTDHSGTITQKVILRPVEDEFFHELLAKGYSIASRSDLDKVIKERSLQVMNLVERDMPCVGRLLHAKAILIVSLDDVSQGDIVHVFDSNGKETFATLKMTIGARMIDSESAQVLWTSSYSGEYFTGNMHPDEVSITALALMARAVAAELPAPRPAGTEKEQAPPKSTVRVVASKQNVPDPYVECLNRLAPPPPEPKAPKPQTNKPKKSKNPRSGKRKAKQPTTSGQASTKTTP
ncbi:MAG: hypothetical protein ACJ8AT_05765 [Hyalangium sp.]|uniref:hypothetical protein n=1 Tax=Hyalangium sp. TaxID=2028555 RepID=UPI00389B398A